MLPLAILFHGVLVEGLPVASNDRLVQHPLGGNMLSSKLSDHSASVIGAQIMFESVTLAVSSVADVSPATVIAAVML